MSLAVELIPILDDNYVFAISDIDRQEAIIVDPGDAEPCLEFLERNNLTLSSILITHHHPDHIDGIVDLKSNYGNVQIFAPEKNRQQILNATSYISDGNSLRFDFANFNVLELPGHTLGICGFFEPTQNWLFSGDVVFGLGCGRLFEGTAEMLFKSLKKIKQLPKSTKVFCTHEYTLTNLRFTEMLIDQKLIPNGFDHEHFKYYSNEIENQRKLNTPTVPLHLSTELVCNPFLLSGNVEQLSELRRLRNQFK